MERGALRRWQRHGGAAGRGAGRSARAVTVTTARRSLSEDVSARQKRYLTIMGIRTVALLAAVLLTDGWVRWVCIPLAIVLPYIAVILANGGRENAVDAPEPFEPLARPALGPGTEPPPAASR